MIYYHGCSASVLFDVMDFPKASMSVNGVGFYCTDDPKVAARYGSCVVAFDVGYSNEVTCVVRPIDQRYVEGLASYNECKEGGLEFVFNQMQANKLVDESAEVYVLTREEVLNSK